MITEIANLIEVYYLNQLKISKAAMIHLKQRGQICSGHALIFNQSNGYDWLALLHSNG